MPNVYEPEFDADRDAPPYVWRRAHLGRAAGAQALGASLFAVAPGGSTFPLHAHLHNEELLIVLEGTPTLRVGGEVPDRVLARGEVVAFPAGVDGAHQLRNDTATEVRVLIVSTMVAPEINVFPDSGELWIRDYVPGTEPPAGAFDVHTPLPPADR